MVSSIFSNRHSITVTTSYILFINFSISSYLMVLVVPYIAYRCSRICHGTVFLNLEWIFHSVKMNWMLMVLIINVDSTFLMLLNVSHWYLCLLWYIFITAVCGHVDSSGINRDDTGLFGATTACIINARHADSDSVIIRWNCAPFSPTRCRRITYFRSIPNRRYWSSCRLVFPQL